MYAHALAIDIPVNCPNCVAENRSTIGGNPPHLLFFIDRDGSESYRCMALHGVFTVEEVGAAAATPAGVAAVAKAIADGKASLVAKGLI